MLDLDKPDLNTLQIAKLNRVSRDGRIRTYVGLAPNQAGDQAAPRPDFPCPCSTSLHSDATWLAILHPDAPG